MTAEIVAESPLLHIRRTHEGDLPYVMAAERDPENAPFIGQWEVAEHQATLADPDVRHLIFEARADGRRLGFAIVRGLAKPNGSIELKRIAVTDKGQGFGRAAIRLIKRLTFESWHGHVLWLDVREYNDRAKHLYESEGFVVEGLLRERAIWDGRRVSSYVMSILAEEYHARPQG